MKEINRIYNLVLEVFKTFQAINIRRQKKISSALFNILIISYT